MGILLLFYATLFVLGLGLHLLGGIFLLTALGDQNTGFARSIAKIGLVSVFKPVVTVNESNELTLKRRSYDESVDNEYVSFSDGLMSSIRRYLHDPQNRMHQFCGVKFGFMEEHTGVVFDPRDADFAHRAKSHEKNSSLEYATTQNGTIRNYIRGVFGFREGTRGVDLQSIRYATGGSGVSQALDWVYEIYSRSQDPRSSSMSVWKMLAPVAALLAMIIVGAFLAGSGGGGGGGGSGGAPDGGVIPVGGALLAFASTRLPSRPSRKQVVYATTGIFALVIAVGFIAVFGVSIAIPALTALFAGIFFLPAVAFIAGRGLGAIGLALGRLYLILACFGFKQPVIHLGADDHYRLCEYDDLDADVEPTWYRFARTWVGVTYENSEDAWPGRNSTLTADDIKSMSTHEYPTAGITGGDAVATALTSGGHSGVVPTDPDDDKVYVDTTHALSWFRDVGRGRLLLRALNRAKEKDFGGSDDEDRILYMTLGFAILGLIIDIMVFF